MTEKKKSNGEQKKKEEGDGKKEEGVGGKGNVTVVLKADLHCDGCISKILKCIRSSEGVDMAKLGDGLITVVGKVDPAKIRERVEKKTHRRVEVVSPSAGKNGDGKEKGKGKDNNGGGNAKKKESNDENGKEKSDEKKAKQKEIFLSPLLQPPVTTAVLKLNLHCEGCIKKMRKIVEKTKGYREMKIDKQKEVVTVTGALDVKALVEAMKKHLKKEVHIVPPKKEVEKKENESGGKGKSGGDNKGKNNGGGGDGGENAAGGEKTEGNKIQFQVGHPYPYPYSYSYPVMYDSGQFQYNPYAYGPNNAPQMFSDENPNACSVM